MGKLKEKNKQIEISRILFFLSRYKNNYYGLNCVEAFVLFYVDVYSQKVYYLPIQDYFITNISLFDKLEENRETMSLHVPCDNLVCNEDFELQQIAKSTYIGGVTRELKKIS